MLEGKKNADKWFPVVLTDDGDFKTPETGKVSGDVTCKYSYEAAASLSTHTVTTDEWREAGEGNYWLLIGASEFTSEGKYEVSVTVAGCLIFNFVVEVRDQTVAESMDNVDAVKTKTDNLPANTSTELTTIANAISTVDGIVDDIKSYLVDDGRIDVLLDSILTAISVVQADLDDPDQFKADVSALATALALAAVQTDLDNPDQYKADVSDLATSSSLAIVDGIVDDIKSYLINGGRIDLLLDAIKVKTDTLGGAGAVTWAYVITDSSTGLPLDGVEVWVTTDIEGTNVIATRVTGASGIVTFYLDAGDYYFWSRKSGYVFVNPDKETVA